jgi:ankyrin repeat protein
VEDAFGDSLVHYLAKYGCKTALNTLLMDRAVDVDKRNHRGRKPLFLTVVGGYEGVARSLVNAGANVRHAASVCGVSRGTPRRTILEISLKKGYFGIARMLVQAGALLQDVSFMRGPVDKYPKKVKESPETMEWIMGAERGPASLKVQCMKTIRRKVVQEGRIVTVIRELELPRHLIEEFFV